VGKVCSVNLPVNDLQIWLFIRLAEEMQQKIGIKLNSDFAGGYTPIWKVLVAEEIPRKILLEIPKLRLVSVSILLFNLYRS